MTTITIPALLRRGPCPAARDYVMACGNLEFAWKKCDRGGWMLWLMREFPNKGHIEKYREIGKWCLNQVVDSEHSAYIHTIWNKQLKIASGYGLLNFIYHSGWFIHREILSPILSNEFDSMLADAIRIQFPELPERVEIRIRLKKPSMSKKKEIEKPPERNLESEIIQFIEKSKRCTNADIRHALGYDLKSIKDYHKVRRILQKFRKKNLITFTEFWWTKTSKEQA